VNFFRADEGILEQGMRKQLKENLAMLKDLLEGARVQRGIHVPTGA
jgi:hypothetical protein